MPQAVNCFTEHARLEVVLDTSFLNYFYTEVNNASLFKNHIPEKTTRKGEATTVLPKPFARTLQRQRQWHLNLKEFFFLKFQFCLHPCPESWEYELKLPVLNKDNFPLLINIHPLA